MTIDHLDVAQPSALEPAEPMPSALWLVLTGIADLDTQRQALADAGDVTELAVWLAQARTVRKHLAVLERNLEDDVARLMPERVWEHPTAGVLERHGGRDRKNARWDEILNAALPLLIAKHEGEIMPAVGELLSTIVPLSPSKTPRLEAMKGLGLDPDEFMESRPKRKTVQIHGGMK